MRNSPFSARELIVNDFEAFMKMDDEKSVDHLIELMKKQSPGDDLSSCSSN